MNVMLYQLLEEARELWDMRLRDKKRLILNMREEAYAVVSF